MKRYGHIILIAWLFLTVLFFSCRKDIKGYLPPDQYRNDDFSQVFEAFWTGMNSNYVFWSIDTTDWDRIYKEYQPKFAQLNINDSQNLRRSTAFFWEMTAGLIDAHFDLSFTHPYLRRLRINPSLVRKSTRINAALPDSFFYKTILNNYLDQGASWGQKDFLNPLRSDNDRLSIITGTIQRKILYLHFNRFYLQLLHDSASIAPVWNNFLNLLQHLPVDFKGFILDLRSNGGGSSDDLNFLSGKLTNHSILFGYTRAKSNIGRLDYTPWVPAVVKPDPTAVSFSQPIVVLTDQHSKSMAEITTMALKQLSNVHVIGDTTWGATGPLSSNFNRDNGGQFHFAKFGFVFTSSMQFKYIDGQIYEGRGFPPDEYVPNNKDSIKVGIDVQLTAAIKYLLK